MLSNLFIHFIDTDSFFFNILILFINHFSIFIWRTAFPSLFFNLFYNQQQVKWMKKVTFKLELLIVMNSI